LQFSDDEEEQKRIVRSAKEKRFEELKDLIRQIKNFKKIKDLSNMLTCFEDLTKAYQKALPVIVKEEKGVTPRFYVQCLVEVETFLNELWEDRDGRKNLSKNNSKSLSTLRQKMRKYVKDFESDIAKFKENPDVEVEDEEDADKSDESSDDEVGPAAFRKSDSDARKAPKVCYKLIVFRALNYITWCFVYFSFLGQSRCYWWRWKWRLVLGLGWRWGIVFFRWWYQIREFEREIP